MALNPALPPLEPDPGHAGEGTETNTPLTSLLCDHAAIRALPLAGRVGAARDAPGWLAQTASATLPSGEGERSRRARRATMNKITRSKDLMIPKVTTGPISAITKVYTSPEGHPDVRVPFREIALTEGAAEKSFRVYDPSGPYTDAHATIDVEKGLPRIRDAWVASAAASRTTPAATSSRRTTATSRASTSPATSPTSRRRCAACPASRSRNRVCPRRHHHQGDDLRRPPREPRPHGRARPRQGGRGRRRELRRRHPRAHHAGVRARRDRARPRHHPGQHQSRRAGADDHRPQLPGEDQRQHRQLGRHLLRRGGGREDGVGDPLGRRHRHGPLHRPQHPQHARVDPAQLAGAHRHGADLPGAGEVRRRPRQAHLGDLPRHADRAVRAGRRLFHHPRRRAPAPTCRSPPTA